MRQESDAVDFDCPTFRRMEFVVKLSALVMVAFVMLARAEVVLQEDRRPGLFRQVVRVDSVDFDAAEIEAICRRVLARQGNTPFVQVEVVTVEGQPPPKPDHITYEYWRRFHYLVRKSAGARAEMIAMSGSAILRLREPSGRVTKKVLSGTDPLAVSALGGPFELLHFGFSFDSPSRLSRVNVFAKARGPLDADAGRALWRRLEASFPSLALFLYLRNDEWFVYEPGFPFFDPFADPAEPPPQSSYDKERTLSCGVWSEKLECSTH